jgi:hypothetical protein
MPSAADDCWRLSADCGRWATESRDNAARLAFRQMATAWAGLAFSQDFVSATHEPVDLTGFESSQAVPAANIASSNTGNEKIVPVSDPEVNAESPEQTTRATTTNLSEQRERLSLLSSIPFILPTHETVDLTGFESSQAVPAANIASSNTENEEIVPVSDPEVNAENPEQTTRATTTNLSEQRERLSLPSPTPFPSGKDSSRSTRLSNWRPARHRGEPSTDF